MEKGAPNRSPVGCATQSESNLAGGSMVPGAVRELEISEATFRRRRQQYGEMSSREAKRLKEIEKENARL